VNFLLAFKLFAPLLSAANSPAPIVIEAGPSYALKATAPDLIVQKEDLEIHCQFSYCNVHASYEINSPKDMSLAFQFILPSKNEISPKINEVAATVSGLALLPGGSEAPLFQAGFQGYLKAGKNILSVRYLQPLKMNLRRGYVLSSAEGDSSFRYIFSPLKEWKLGDNFSLKIKVLWDLPRRNFFSRLFGGGYREILCNEDEIVAKQSSDRVLSVPNGEAQVMEFEFGSSFPDELKCSGSLSPELSRIYEGDPERLSDAFLRHQDENTQSAQ
jgi:hypothetical protein